MSCEGETSLAELWGIDGAGQREPLELDAGAQTVLDDKGMVMRGPPLRLVLQLIEEFMIKPMRRRLKNPKKKHHALPGSRATCGKRCGH
jgi:hypothetical protein